MSDVDNTSTPDGQSGPLAEATKLAEEAFALLQKGKPGASANKLGRAARLAETSGDYGEYSRYLYSQALTLAQLPQERQRAESLWRKSAAAAQMAGRIDLEIKALQRIAPLYANDGDLEGAIAELTALIERMNQHEGSARSAELVGIMRDRARLYMTRGIDEQNRIFLDRAHADLEAAAALARSLDLNKLALETRLELRALEALRPDSDEPPETFASLRAEAEALGDSGILGSLELEQAMADMRAGEFARAHQHADAARQAALDTPDPVRYLIACMLIAEARENLDDRAGVIAILLTCKASLERLMGDTAGQQVRMVLDSLERRWGHDGVAAALAEYRARVAQRRPV